MDFEKMSLSALREAAKNSGIKSVSTLRKTELIELLKKESDSIEKAAEELERFAAEDEQKAGKETASKQGHSKKTEERVKDIKTETKNDSEAKQNETAKTVKNSKKQLYCHSGCHSVVLCF